MYLNKINEEYDFYIENNHSNIRKKLKILEQFRTNEEKLRDYVLTLSLLDKMQNEVGFSYIENEYNKMLKDLKNFDPHNIVNEIRKIYAYMDLIENFKIEISSVSEKIKKIEKIWNSFIERNQNIKNTTFEDMYNSKLESIKNEIKTIGINNISSVLYGLDKLKDFVEHMILIIEKITLLKTEYVYIGKEAEDLKNKIESKLTFNENVSLEEFEEVIENINEMYTKSITGVVGFPVYKVYTKEEPNIYKHTLKINNEYLKYEPFFLNESLLYENTGEYFYFENFPKEGVFKGREIIENLNVSNKYVSFLSCVRENSEKYINFSLLGLFLISMISAFSQNLGIAIFSSLIILFFFIFKEYGFSLIKELCRDKYLLENAFVFKKIYLTIFTIGEDISHKEVISEIIKNFDKVFKNLEGDHKWIQKYLSQKNH